MWRGGSVPLGERLSIRAYRPPVSSKSARTVNRQPRDHTEDSGSARRAYGAAAPSGSIVMRLLLSAPGGCSLFRLLIRLDPIPNYYSGKSEGLLQDGV